MRADPRRAGPGCASPRRRSGRWRRARRRRARPAPPRRSSASTRRRPLPGEVDEELLAGAMHLAHRRLQRPPPLAIPLAELAVGVAASGCAAAILLPQQRERHAGLLQLLMDLGPRRERPVGGQRGPGETGAPPAPRRPGRPAAARSPRQPAPAGDRPSPSPSPRRTPAQWRAAGSRASYFRRSNSRSCRISSLEAAIQGVLSLKETSSIAWLPISAQRARGRCSPSPESCSACRNQRSASPDSLFSMPGIGVQHPPESRVQLQSESAVQHGPERAIRADFKLNDGSTWHFDGVLVGLELAFSGT